MKILQIFFGINTANAVLMTDQNQLLSTYFALYPAASAILRGISVLSNFP